MRGGHIAQFLAGRRIALAHEPTMTLAHESQPRCSDLTDIFTIQWQWWGDLAVWQMVAVALSGRCHNLLLSPHTLHVDRFHEVRIGRAQEVVHAQIHCLFPNVSPHTQCIEVSVAWAWTGATPG